MYKMKMIANLFGMIAYCQSSSSAMDGITTITVWHDILNIQGLERTFKFVFNNYKAIGSATSLPIPISEIKNSIEKLRN